MLVCVCRPTLGLHLGPCTWYTPLVYPWSTLIGLPLVRSTLGLHLVHPWSTLGSTVVYVPLVAIADEHHVAGSLQAKQGNIKLTA